jgi:hypothetical protein
VLRRFSVLYVVTYRHRICEMVECTGNKEGDLKLHISCAVVLCCTARTVVAMQNLGPVSEFCSTIRVLNKNSVLTKGTCRYRDIKYIFPDGIRASNE